MSIRIKKKDNKKRKKSKRRIIMIQINHMTHVMLVVMLSKAVTVITGGDGETNRLRSYVLLYE